MRATREVFLTFGALLGVVCILATIAGAAFDVKPLVFRSGSMSPAIHTGDLGVSRTVDASTLRRGDIVSVVNSGGNRVTHRLVSTAAQGDARQLTLRGDANRSPDAELYTVTTAEKVLFDIPKAGYAVDAATSPVGLFLLGLYVAGMLALVFRRRPPDGPEDRALVLPPGGSRKAARSKRSKAAFRMSVALGAAVSLTLGSAASAAPWTDPVVISGTTFGAHTVLEPASVTCSGGGLLASLTFTWPNSDLRYEYVVTVEDSGGTVRRTDVISNSGSLVTSQSVTYSFLLLNGILGLPATITIRVRSRLAGSPTWVSNGSTTATGKLLSVLFLGLASSCN
ncbi:signal peptidase I [Aeromicrobium sp. A1-2]|uniref:signal peptidase I n=1 Tax=Aeromicrobium sp. A1-2 TaxID=2107713 RepID=UPI0013C2FE87|nr:signal peptidase I [Aeromicrobium sp. A1-2]